MVGKDLPEDLRNIGHEVLDVLDGLALEPEGALWLWRPSVDVWRFYVVTSLVDILGRRETYRLVANAFDATTKLVHMDVDDVRVVGPDDDPFSRLPRSDLRDPSYIRSLSSDGDMCEAYLYRMRPVEQKRVQDVSRRVKDPIRIIRRMNVEAESALMRHESGMQDHPPSSLIPVTGDIDSSRGVFDEVVPIPGEIQRIMKMNLELVAA